MTETWKAPRALGLLCLVLLGSACAKSTVEDREALDDMLSAGNAADAGDDKINGGGDSSSTGAQDSGTNGTDSGAGSGSSSGGSQGSATGGTTGGSSGTASTTGGQTGGTQPDMSDAGTMMPTGPACDPGTTACGSSCVDLKSSAANCGACGHSCPGAQACDGAGVCTAPSGCTYASFGKHEYFFCTNAKNWVDARAACLSFGLDLAVIEDATENDFIKTKGQQWIGLSDRDAENTWLWVSRGEASTTAGFSTPFRPWRSGEPNNDCDENWLGRCGRPAGEDCVEVYTDGSWNDGDCGRSQGFACETY